MAKKRQSRPVNVLDVAAYILANHFDNKPILAWKMHKFAYLCQMKQIEQEGVPMFSEKIVATPKGVVIKELLPLHRNQWYSGDSSKGNLNHLSLKQTDVIADVIKNYDSKTIEELDELIQQTSYWKKTMLSASNKSDIFIIFEE